MTRPRPQRADDGAVQPFDTARCPRGCGDTLSFRSNPTTGMTEQCCWTCRTPWASVPRRYVVGPTTEYTDPTNDRYGDKRRLVLAAVPVGFEHAARVRDICASVTQLDRTTVDRILRRLRVAELVESERTPAGIVMWREAA